MWVIVLVAVSGCWASAGPSDTRWTITTSNPSRYSRRTKICGQWEDRVVVRYINSLGARRRPSSHALPSDPVFHETNPGRNRLAAKVAYAPERNEHRGGSSSGITPSPQSLLSSVPPFRIGCSCGLAFSVTTQLTTRAHKWMKHAKVLVPC
jgi:hypothetical protein